MKIPVFAVSALAAVALGMAVAGCGGGGSSSAAPASGASGASASAASGSSGAYGYGGRGGGGSSSSSSAVTVKAASSPLGTILVDQDGKTLYLFEADSGTMSNCNGACTSYWPPVTVSGKAAAGAGVTGGLLGTTKRSDGSTEVTYAGHPLYWFSGDSAAGDVNGQGLTDFGGAWYAVSPAGKAVVGPGA